MEVFRILDRIKAEPRFNPEKYKQFKKRQLLSYAFTCLLWVCLVYYDWRAILLLFVFTPILVFFDYNRTKNMLVLANYGIKTTGTVKSILCNHNTFWLMENVTYTFQTPEGQKLDAKISLDRSESRKLNISEGNPIEVVYCKDLEKLNTLANTKTFRHFNVTDV